ncbi:MAG: response regulator [Anaerolineae bacterium]|nr:response regulator [Anaerolineae bacterium]MBL8104255.1 response regulator [Anaerolineales bacterium]MCC7189934.1 response regulator [Anaerolineales bacterium]
MKTKVLWVEDSARLELRNLTGPIYISGEYDINLAEDATSAVRYLLTKEYDVVILDMRLPPGIDDYWVNVYRERGEDNADARLGLELANWLLSHKSDISFPPPGWIRPYHVGVFTVENDAVLHASLEDLNIQVFQQKVAGLKDTILVDLIDRIKEQNPKYLEKTRGLK